MKRKINPEWVKLGPKADVHFLSDYMVPIMVGPAPIKVRPKKKCSARQKKLMKLPKTI